MAAITKKVELKNGAGIVVSPRTDIRTVENASGTTLDVILNTKVDKEAGKALSTNDYTTAEKTKLTGIQTGAQVNAVTTVAGRTGAVVLTKTDVGLANVDNTTDLNKPISTATQTALNTKINSTEKGTANGVATLDATGKVPSGQLPSYVDDVLEFANKAAFPATGENGKIYVDIATNLTWRWSGTAYVEISPSIALGETQNTAYRGDRGKIAYDHSQINETSPMQNRNPHGTGMQNIVGLDEAINARPTTAQVQAMIGSSVPSYDEATTAGMGLIRVAKQSEAIAGDTESGLTDSDYAAITPQTLKATLDTKGYLTFTDLGNI